MRRAGNASVLCEERAPGPAGAAHAGLRLGSEPTDENLIFC